MRNFTNRVFQTQGSNDEVTIEITGREWIKLFKLMKQKWLYLIVIITTIFSFSAPYLLSYIQGKLATALIDSDYDSPDEFLNSINHITNLLLLATVTLFGMNLSSSISDAVRSPQFLRELRTSLFTSFLDQELGYFDTMQTGIVLSRLQDDTLNAFDAYTSKLITIFRMLVNWIIGLVTCLSINKKITLIILVCLPFYAIAQLAGTKAINKIWKEYSESTEDVSAKQKKY